MFTPDQKRLFSLLAQCASQRKVGLYAVGGVVRDLLLGHALSDKDCDFLVDGDAIEFATECAKIIGGTVKQFPEFLTAKIVHPSLLGTTGSENTESNNIEEIDFASPRQEVYPVPGQLPTVSRASVHEDLKRRDFSINALAIKIESLYEWAGHGHNDPSLIEPEVIDQFGGLEDLRRRWVRVLHERSFIDDPTRIFRALRYVVRINGALEPSTQVLLDEAVRAGCLSTISTFRKINEIKRIFEEERPDDVLLLLMRHGVWDKFPLCAVENRNNLLADVRALAALRIIVPLRFEVVLHLFFKYLDPSTREGTFLDWGFGKRGAKRCQRVLAEASTSKDYKKLSDHGLILKLINGRDAQERALLREALVDRQLARLRQLK